MRPPTPPARPSWASSRAHAHLWASRLPLHPSASPGPGGTRPDQMKPWDRENDPIRSRDGSGGRGRPRLARVFPLLESPAGLRRRHAWGCSHGQPLLRHRGGAVSFSGSRRSVVGERGPRGPKLPHSPGQSRAEPRPATCGPRGPLAPGSGGQWTSKGRAGSQPRASGGFTAEAMKELGDLG